MISYWEKDILLEKFDVIIVGAGFSGSWLAYEILKLNNKIKLAIIEKSPFSAGASTKNAGFACFGSASEILENISLTGEDSTLNLTKLRFNGIKKIKNEFNRDIDYLETNSYELFNDKETFENVLKELKQLNDHIKSSLNISNHFSISENTFDFKGFDYVIQNKQEAQINPYKLLTKLHNKIRNLNGKIILNEELKSFELKNDTYFLKTSSFSFQTTHLSFCTNAFTNKFFPEYGIKPGRGQVIITQPISNLKIKGMFHFDKGYFYMRNVNDRILIGGGRNLDFETETTSEFGSNPLLLNKLEDYLKNNFLSNCDFEIDSSWSGIMAFNDSKAPISKLENKNLSINACMNGMGVALAPILAESLSKSIVENL